MSQKKDTGVKESYVRKDTSHELITLGIFISDRLNSSLYGY